MKKINYKLTLVAIYEFMNTYYYENNKDIGGFMSSLMPMDDGYPADQAIFDDWLDAVNKKDELDIEDCYHKMFKFLEIQSTMGWPEIFEFLKKEKFNSKATLISLEQLVKWKSAIEDAEKNIECSGGG